MNGHQAAPNFPDNAVDYSDFAATTTEKQETARLIASLAKRDAFSKKHVLNVADIGMGDGHSVMSLLERIAANQHQNINVLAKETDPATILKAIEHMAQRLAHYPKTIISLTNGPNAKIMNCELGKREQLIVESRDTAEMVDELNEKLPSLLDIHWKQARKLGTRSRTFKHNTTLDIHHAERADDEAPFYDIGFNVALALQAGNVAANASKRAKYTMTPALWALKPGAQYFATQAGTPSPLYEAFSEAGIEIPTFAASLEEIWAASREQLEQKQGGAQGFKSKGVMEFDYEVTRKQGWSDDAYLHAVFAAMAYHVQITRYSHGQQTKAIELLRASVGHEPVKLNNQLLAIEHDQ